MSFLDTKPLQPDFIKMRWLEPYVSSGLNRKTFKSLPRGIYAGFVVKAGPGPFEITIAHDDPEGYGLVSGYSGGAFDSASGWSIAVHESLQGFTSTVAIQAGPGANFVFDLAAHAGQTVFPVVGVNFRTGYETQGQVGVVEASDLDADPTLINLARIDVPVLGPLSQANIIYDDPTYPRVLPFATPFKYGFMSKFQAELLEDLVGVSGSPAFSSAYIVPVSGPQIVSLPISREYIVGADDLWVFKNGRKTIKGRDYLEIDRGDGKGDEIDYVGGDLREGDVIEFRIQQYSAVLSSTTHVLDEGTLISPNAYYLNFKGAGVSVLPDGPGRARIVIPGGGGGSSAVKTRVNNSGSLIQAYRAVHIMPDNTIVPCNPTNLSHKLYGILLQNVPHLSSGDVQLAGMIEGAGAGVSGIIGDDVFISHLGDGSLTVVPPSVSGGSVLRVGILDGADGVSGGSPVDILFDRGRLP